MKKNLIHECNAGPSAYRKIFLSTELPGQPLESTAHSNNLYVITSGFLCETSQHLKPRSIEFQWKMTIFFTQFSEFSTHMISLLISLIGIIITKSIIYNSVLHLNPAACCLIRWAVSPRFYRLKIVCVIKSATTRENLNC